MHYAVQILDLFVSKTSKDTEDMELEVYAIGALFIAAKSYEKDDNIPKSGELINHLNSSHHKKDPVTST